MRRAGQYLWPAGVSLLLAAVCLIDPGGRIETLEQKTLDARARAFATLTDRSADIVLLDISEQTLKRLEPVFGRWPWPRSAHGDVVEYLKRDGAKVVAFDLIFSERTRSVRLDETTLNELSVFAGNADIPEVRDELISRLGQLKPSAGDEYLAAKIAGAANVVNPVVFYVDDAEAQTAPAMVAQGEALTTIEAALAGSRVPDSGYAAEAVWFHAAIVPFSELAIASQSLGHINFLPDSDGVCRRFRPLQGFAGTHGLYPSLPLAVAAAALHVKPDRIKAGRNVIEIGDRRIPVLPDGSAFVRYQGGRGSRQGTAPYVFEPYENVLASAGQAARGVETLLPKGRFKDKIVIVGATAVGLKDVRSTPLASLAPSFEIQANIVDDILSGLVPRSLPQAARFVLVPLVCLAAALAVAGARASRGLPVALAVCAGPPLAAWFAYGHGLIAPMAGPALAALASTLAAGTHKYARESRDKARIKSAFGQYLAPAVMEEILKHPEKLSLGGEKRVMTVMFTDIVAFTALAESLPAEKVSAMLNGYFTRMAACVVQTGGIVDKFIGDALMAEWNAPGIVEDHAGRACRAALAMRGELESLNAERAATGEPPIAMRVGVNTGEMIVGNMGAQTIFDYSVVGDEVNAASRLEALGKLFGCPILISGTTAEAAQASEHGAFALRRLGRVRIKGRIRDMAVFELAGLAGEIEDAGLAARAAYESGLARYEAGKFAEAAEDMERVLALVPGDGPAALLLGLCRELSGKPVSQGWTGIIEQKEK